VLAVTQTNEANSWSAIATVAFVAPENHAIKLQLLPLTATVAAPPVLLITVY